MNLCWLGGEAELVQLIGAHDCDHVCRRNSCQLVSLRLAQHPQLQLDVQAHLGGVGG